MGCDRLQARIISASQVSTLRSTQPVSYNVLQYETFSGLDHTYLDFVSGAGLLTAVFGETGSSGMPEACVEAKEAEDGPTAERVGWFFSDLSDLSNLSDLEERLMRFRNPPLLFF